MRLTRALLGSALMATPCAFAQPQPLGPLWRSASDSIVLTPCPAGDHDEQCRAVSVRSGGREVALGGGYERVTLLWSRKGKSGDPDALVLGDSGGSGGYGDLFAIRFTPHIAVRKLSGERMDTVTARTAAGRLRLTIPFDTEFFNGAPHAGAIVLPLPMVWTGGDFAVDLAELTRRTYSPSELDFRELAMREELEAWAQDKFPASRLFPPEARGGTQVTATALLEMMLSGHADQARGLLDRAWPRHWDHGDRQLGGEADFWAALCRATVSNRAWKRFDLARLPHADLIAQGANRTR